MDQIEKRFAYLTFKVMCAKMIISTSVDRSDLPQCEHFDSLPYNQTFVTHVTHFITNFVIIYYMLFIVAWGKVKRKVHLVGKNREYSFCISENNRQGKDIFERGPGCWAYDILKKIMS